MIPAGRSAAASLSLVLAIWSTPILAQEPGAEAEPPARAEVLVLGVYHMANPGQDVFNTEADDVLSPKRQAEIVERAEEDVGFYYRQVHFGEPWNWAGADLLTSWFERNIRIHSNVVDLVDSPEERILMIFGAGHLGWLRGNVASDPTLRLRKLGELVR